METLTLFVLRGEFGCNPIINCFIEQDLKFESFGNLGSNYTLMTMLSRDYVYMRRAPVPSMVYILETTDEDHPNQMGRL